MRKNHKFENSTYLSQVRRLRKFAEQALRAYPIGKYELKFIQHGENCTFKVITKKQNYLLRIHRANYHSKKSIHEELKWLRYLNENSEIDVQSPIEAKYKTLVNELNFPQVGKRYFVLLTWKDGFVKYKKSINDFYSVGSLLAELQNNTINSRHRNYWMAEGLLGNNATFGSIKLLKDNFPKAYEQLEPCRREVLNQLKVYESKKDAKIGLMHADLHFGNMIWTKNGVSPIDFDDCGNGIQVYDLAVTFYSSSNFFKKIGKRQTSLMKHSLIDGFNSKKALSQIDIDLIPHLVRARDILMIAWLCERQDNPVLRDHLNKELMTKVKRIQANKEYKI